MHAERESKPSPSSSMETETAESPESMSMYTYLLLSHRLPCSIAFVSASSTTSRSNGASMAGRQDKESSRSMTRCTADGRFSGDVLNLNEIMILSLISLYRPRR